MSSSSSTTGIGSYPPSKPVCIVFIVLFGLSTLAHIGQALQYRLRFLLPTAVLCGVMETVGWGSRHWNSSALDNDASYIIQSLMLTVGPTPLLAANFVIFGRIIRVLGPDYSRLTPRWYTGLFLTSDIVALLLQSTGGGISAASDTAEGSDLGLNIVLTGIVFQLAVIVIFIVCAVEYAVRYIQELPVRKGVQGVARGELTLKVKIMLGALAFSTISLLIRAAFRTAELAEGWGGRIMETEVYFNVFDGMMILLAMYSFNIVHPGMFLVGPNIGEADHVELEQMSNRGDPENRRSRMRGVMKVFRG